MKFNTITYKGIYSVIIGSVAGWGLTYFSIEYLNEYVSLLFFSIPFVIGIIPGLIIPKDTPKRFVSIQSFAFISLAVYTLGLLFFAFEGIICIAMAIPFAVPLTLLGGVIGNELTLRLRIPMILLLCLIPIFMSFEADSISEDEIRSVTTSIEISAPPEVVWKNVVVFPQLEAPTELIFKAGIAYPINAQIDGYGVGAIRYCNFSTGSFVEPITVWDEPTVLKFDVTSQPEPMKELSIYDDVHPPHLNGFWVSKEGEFKLTKLPNGNTRIDGTTWYVNKIKPDFYWTLWSDYIVHTIHERVLNHIKKQSEDTALNK